MWKLFPLFNPPATVVTTKWCSCSSGAGAFWTWLDWNSCEIFRMIWFWLQQQALRDVQAMLYHLGSFLKGPGNVCNSRSMPGLLMLRSDRQERTERKYGRETKESKRRKHMDRNKITTMRYRMGSLDIGHLIDDLSDTSNLMHRYNIPDLVKAINETDRSSHHSK